MVTTSSYGAPAGARDEPELAHAPKAALLATKLLSPPIRADLLARPRLLARLRHGLRGPLTLLSAPAGFGKTTTLSGWLAASGAHAEWLSLDADDSSPARFWSYVCAACDRLAPGCAAAALALLRAPQPAPLAAVVAALINSLAGLPPGAGPERPYVLVLDDYQLIDSQAVHESLALLIERLPPQLHLAIAARADPPLPLARLRARGLVTELRAADLRFSLEEARVLLGAVEGLALSRAAVELLEARTEGWIAGLQLAALALRDQHDPEAFVAAFAGSHHYIVDYLADEVLAQQPPHIHSFLLRTAILDRLSAGLCDALLDVAPGEQGRGVSQEILAELARKNLFLVALDSERRWYRYHQLFADVLRARLRETAPALEPDMHRRASAWYAGQIAVSGPAYLTQAVRHAIAAGQGADAARLIERAADALLRQGDFAQLIQLIRELPPAMVVASAPLNILLARALFDATDLEALPAALAAAARALPGADLPPAERDRLQAWLLALESQLLRARGSYAAAIDRAREALALLPDEAQAARGFMTMGLALALQMGGRLREAVAPYQQALALIDPDNAHGTIITRCLKGMLYCRLGEWQAAERVYRQAIADAQQPPGRLPAVGWPMVGLAELAYRRDDLAEAERQLSAGLALAEQGGVRDALTMGYTLLVLLRQAQGRPAEARAASDAFVRFATDEFSLPRAISLSGAVAARLALLQGDLAAAERWAQGYRSASGAVFQSQALELSTYLGVLLRASRAPEALALIAEQLAQAEAAGDRVLALELQVLAARAHAMLGQIEPALAALDRALAIAEPIEARRALLDEGAPLLALLREARARGRLGGFGRKLLARAEAGAPERPAAQPQRAAPPLAEPLTPREREILGWVAEGRSNQEIAAALVVSVGTVKTHLHNLYGKLDARDRTQAVARGRALGLLD